MSKYAVVQNHKVGTAVTAHLHDQGQLAIVLAGSMTLTCLEGWWIVPSGLAVWIPANVKHTSICSKSTSVVVLRLGPQFDRQLPSRCTQVFASTLLCELGSEAVRLVDTEDKEGQWRLVAQLIVYQIKRLHRQPALFVPYGSDRRLRQITEHLRTNPGCDKTLVELADSAHTSPRTLARLFIIETGLNFRKWRDHLRIVCAIERLTSGQSITTVALDLGYQSASSFTTLFTRSVGIPPRKYMTKLNSVDDTHSFSVPTENQFYIGQLISTTYVDSARHHHQ